MGREWGAVGLDRVGYSCDCMNRIGICAILNQYYA